MPSRKVKVLVPMSDAQHTRLAHKANALGLSVAELLRRGAEQYVPPDTLALLANEVICTSDKAIHSIDSTLAIVAQSEARIQALQSSHSAHKVGR